MRNQEDRTDSAVVEVVMTVVMAAAAAAFRPPAAVPAVVAALLAREGVESLLLFSLLASGALAVTGAAGV